MDIVNGVIGLGILYGVGHYMTRNNKPSRKRPSNTKSIKNKTANNFNTKTRNTSTNQPLNKTNTQTNQPLNKTNRQTNQPLNKTNRQTNQPPKTQNPTQPATQNTNQPATQNTNQPATQNTNQPATQNTNQPKIVKTPNPQHNKTNQQPNATPVNVKKDTSDVINLLFWNILYTNFKDKKGDKIVDYINKTKPDIMVLNEASHLVPKDNIGKKDYYDNIKLYGYTSSVYHAKKDTDGTLIYFNPSKFKLLKRSEGISIGRELIPFVNVNRPYIDKGFSRACLGVTLDYDGKHIHVIGVHLGHHVPLETIQKGIKQIMDELDIQPEDRVILGGDFNELYQIKNYETAFDGLTLYKKVNTLVGKTNAPSDLIYSNRPLTVDQGKGPPSDHFALIAKIEK
jgi:endonuclease/exonuclease/phosphatase family metal-dependent hydrolase